MRYLQAILSFIICLILSGCELNHDEHITGPYRLSAIDINSQMSIYYDLEGGSGVGRINETVFAYGYDKTYIVAKQHPKSDKTITNYFYLDMRKDRKYAEPLDSVTGPLTKKEFLDATLKLKLPKFTRVIKNLQ